MKIHNTSQAPNSNTNTGGAPQSHENGLSWFITKYVASVYTGYLMEKMPCADYCNLKVPEDKTLESFKKCLERCEEFKSYAKISRLI